MRLDGRAGCERGHRAQRNIAAGRFAQPAPNEGRARRLAGFALRCGRVPPGARAGHQPVVSLEHLHRLANAIPGELPAHRARLVALLRREPGAFMPPEAWADRFLWCPVAGLDEASTPTVFDHEARRRPRVERGNVIVRVTAESRADALGVGQRDVIGLPDVVETEQLDHHVVHAVLARFDEREAVVTRVDVAEIGAERLEDVIAQPEAEHVAIEGQHIIDTLHREHGMAHAERTGSEAGDVASWMEWLGTDLGAVKRLKPATDRIGEDDDILDAALVGKSATAVGDRDASAFQPGGQRIQCRRVRHFPAEEGSAAVGVGVHDDALFAIVHTQRQRAARLVDKLHAEKPRRVGRPVFQILGADPDIAKRFNRHRSSRAAEQRRGTLARMGERRNPPQERECRCNRLRHFSMRRAQAAVSANSSAISTRSWRALRLLILWSAFKMRTEPLVCMKPKMLSALPLVSRAGEPGAPPKKKESGTSSASEIRCRRPAPMRFTPFSYFCTCWKVTPMRSASSVCDRRHSRRRERTRRPTSASRPSARLARTCLSTILACFMICVFAVCCTFRAAFARVPISLLLLPRYTETTISPPQ